MTQEAGRVPFPGENSPVGAAPTDGFEIPKPKRIRPGHSTVLATKVLQARAVASEMKRLKDRGIRFLPKGRLDKQTIAMINAWADKLNNSAKVSDNLIIAGMDQAEDGIKSVREFTKLKASIKESAKLGLNNLPGLWDRKIWFNCQIAGELLKLAFTLNRSFSFCVHLVLLYGLESLAEELSTVGPHPPNEISSPSKTIAKNQMQEKIKGDQKDKDEAFWARNPTFDPNNRAEPFITNAQGIRDNRIGRKN
jgi:hypothetical protein